jgi:AraC-like DNA-binding protein
LLPVAFDWVEFIVVREGVCQVRHSDGGEPAHVREGGFVFLMPNVPCGIQPDGQAEVIRLFVSAEFLLQIVVWRHPALRLDGLTAPVFAREEYPDPFQVVRAGPDGREALFGSLDWLCDLTRRRVIGANLYDALDAAFGALRHLGPRLRNRHGWEVESPQATARRATQACFSTLRPITEPIRRARAMIDARYTKRLTVKQLADEAGLSESHLRHEFAEQMGKPPTVYRNTLRVLRMAWLLTRTDTTMGRIAGLVGWRDRRTAAKAFKDAAGIGPGDYRRPVAGRWRVSAGERRGSDDVPPIGARP